MRLLEYFSGRELAREAHLAGCAEDTAHGAARLAGDTRRSPAVFIGHEHRFNELLVVQLVGALERSVLRNLFRGQ